MLWFCGVEDGEGRLSGNMMKQLVLNILDDKLINGKDKPSRLDAE